MLPVFELERYLLRYEPEASISLCASGLESMALPELLALADAESRALWERLTLEYSLPEGLPLLRSEIARQYDRLDESEACVFAGASEALYCVMNGLLTPADHAIVVVPCYQSLQSIPANLCSVSCVALDEPVPGDGPVVSGENGETSRWRLDLAKLEQAIRPNTRLIVINFPNNPTGALPDAATMTDLIELARQRGIYILSDEVYRLMELYPDDRLPPIVDAYERGISIASMSKPYGLSGLRVGWAACRDAEVLRAAVNVKHYGTICPNTTGEVLALMALRAGTVVLEKNRAVMTANLPEMQCFFERHADRFEWQSPRGGCLGFPKLRNEGTADDFAHRLRREAGVLVLPGSLYGWPGSRFRISFGRRNMPAALDKLEAFLATDPVSCPI